METIKLREDYIKLGQALKAAGFVESGVDAKYAIEDVYKRQVHKPEYCK